MAIDEANKANTHVSAALDFIADSEDFKLNGARLLQGGVMTRFSSDSNRSPRPLPSSAKALERAPRNAPY
jgi:hypothetical protein